MKTWYQIYHLKLVFGYITFKKVHGSLCSSFKIPEIHWQYSTKRVLTMEFCEGGKVDNLPYMKNHKISSDEASQNYLITTCANMVDVMTSISVLAYFEDLIKSQHLTIKLQRSV